jgi:hypothetical protein
MLKLQNYAEENAIDFYFEALPVALSDYINTHKELLEFGKPIHVDFATMIANNESIDFLKENLIYIKRFHVSVPGYSYNFSDYPQIKDWVYLLTKNNIKGVIEVQNYTEGVMFQKEIEWLVEKV